MDLDNFIFFPLVKRLSSNIIEKTPALNTTAWATAIFLS